MGNAFDASAKNGAGGTNSLTIAHTCTGSNRALLVAVVGNTTTDDITGVTYNGVAMTQVAKVQHASGARWNYLYYLSAPPTGTNNIVISASASIYIEGNSASYTGVSQTGQPEAVATNSAASGTSLTTSVTTLTDNAWTVLAAMGQGGTITAGSGATLRNSQLVGAILDSNGAVTPAGSKSMTFNAVNNNFGGIIVSLAPASSGITVDCTVGDAVAAGTAATITMSTVTLTDQTNLRVHQRNGTSSSVTFTGTYTGSPTAIQARVVLDGTSTEVVTWTTIDAAPAGGTFSGSLTVPQGGWYNVQVRFSNSTGVVSNGTNKWGVGILVLTIGQSQARNWFEVGTNSSPSLVSKHSGAVSPSTAGTWAALGTTAQGADAFGSALVSQYSVPVGLFKYGIGSTTISQWDQTTDQLYKDALKAVTDNGGALEYVIWAQGENDALAATAQATYETALGNLVTNLRADITNRSTKSNLPVLVSLLGRGSTMGSDADVERIRDAQLARIAAIADVYLGSTTADLDLSDGIHYTGAGYAKHGERMAQTVKYLLGDATYYRGPYILRATIVDSTHTDVTLVHRGGTDFLPTTAIKGFELDDSGAISTPSAAARQDATTIRLTHSAIGAGSTLRYLYGADGGVTFANTFSDEVIDNTSLALPLEGGKAFAITSNITIDCTPGNAVAAGVAAGFAVSIPCTVGNAVAAGVTATITITGTKTASITLVNTSGAAQASLTGLKWAWFDEVTPDLFTAPTDQGVAEITDGSGVLTVDIPGSAKTSGQVGWLIVTDSDGTTSQSPAHKAFSGPVAVD